MATKNIRMRPEGSGDYGDILHPETNADQIVETTTKKVMTAEERTKLTNALTSVTKADVGLGNVDNLKQMPISGGVLESYSEKRVGLSFSNMVVDLSLASVFVYATTSSTFTMSIINADQTPNVVQSFTLIRTASAAPGTIVYPASIVWAGGTVPPNLANKTYIMTFVTYNNGTTWYGMLGGEF